MDNQWTYRIGLLQAHPLHKNPDLCKQLNDNVIKTVTKQPGECTTKTRAALINHFFKTVANSNCKAGFSVAKCFTQVTLHDRVIHLPHSLRRQNTKYKSSQLVAQHQFFASFGRCLPFFTMHNQLCRATKTLLRVEESCCKKQNAGLLCATSFVVVARFSSNSQLGAQQICSRSGKSTNQSTAFLRPATNVSVADQVDHAR